MCKCPTSARRDLDRGLKARVFVKTRMTHALGLLAIFTVGCGSSSVEVIDDSAPGGKADSIDPTAPWQVIPTPTQAANLIGLWGESSDDFYAITGGEIFHFKNGDASVERTSSNTCPLHAIWGASAADVYVVGACDQRLHSTGDGMWTQGPAVQEREHEYIHDDNFLSISGSGTNSIAIGNWGGRCYRFGGTDWKEFGHDDGQRFASIAIFRNDVIVAGEDLNGQGHVISLKPGVGESHEFNPIGLWAGTDFLYSAGNVKGGGYRLMRSTYAPFFTDAAVGKHGAINAVAGNPETQQVYYVGTNGLVVQLGAGANGRVTSLGPATDKDLLSVWVSPAGDIFAGGAQGTLVKRHAD
jgi:hypothetical protein